MEAFVEKLIEYAVDSFWNNLQFWRILAILLFSLLLSLYTFRHRIFDLWQQDKRQTHDKDIFSRSDGQMNEQQFSEFIDALGTNRYISMQSKQASRFRYFFQSEGNQYLD